MRKFYTSVLFIVFLFTSFSSFSQMIANDDNITTSSGFSSTTILSVTDNDTFNGTPVTASNTDVTSVVNGPISIDADGVLTLASNTPSGTYLVTYQLCNIGNTDCDTAVVTVTITNTIDAVNDGPINVFSSPIFDFLPNVTSNDTLNGNPVTTNNSIVTPVTAGPLSIDPNGQLTLAPNVPSGTYSVTYTICEVNPQTGILVNPANCDTAIVTVVVFNSINAANDSFPSFIPQPNFSTIGNITLNDTFNGTPVTPANTDVTPVTTGPLSVDANGTLTVAPNPPLGTYIINYTICEVGSSPLNCDTATAIVVIQSQILNPIVANNDTIQNINGITGNSNAGNVLSNNGNGADSLNGIPIFNLNLITLSIIVPAIPNNPGSLVPFVNLLTGVISIPANTPAGNYTITYQICEIANPTNCDTAIVTINVTNNLNGIKLNAFLDTNGNGIQNSGEQSFIYGNYTYQINNGAVINLSSNNNGVILYESNPANSYNLTFTVNSSNASQYTVTNSSYSNITVANNSGITTYNFPVTQSPFNDLSISIQQIAGPRPGFIYSNKILFKNLGIQTIASGTITFNVNNIVTISTYPSGANPNATGFTYPFTNLLPYESRYIYVYFQVPTIPTVNIGQLLTNSASITIPVGDINMANNTSTLTQDIRSSYDPNDKQESHGGKIVHSTFTSNDYLTYTIQFENTGNANAINVRVNDILDTKLDETSIRMVDASNAYVLERVGSNLNWKFDGINLPPSVANTQIGHGYITFQIKPKPGYAIGDIIPNFASIYFDFNPAIVTETCNTEFVAALTNENFAFNNFNFYPNPVKDNLKISNNSVIDSVEILSLLGQKMFAKNVNSLETELNLSELSSGIYFVKVTSEGQEKTVKISKN